MSQAFVKEGDASDDLPERPVSDEPNYVTRRGLALLREKVAELLDRRLALLPDKSREAERRLLERDLRYYEARLDSAIVVDRSAGWPDDVRFGAEVEVREDGALKRYEIVGEDEAAPEQGRLSWSSPLARALLGAKPGQDVCWVTPSGESRATIVSVRY